MTGEAMRVFLIGVSGTGMGALAALFVEAGHEVSGSDVAFDAPVGPALRALGVRCLEGYDARHLDAHPDLVVVGNAIRAANAEARAAEEQGLARTSMSAALREHFLARRRPLVVAGTHGKTTTSAMCAWLLSRSGWDPGWFIGGVPKGLDRGAAIGNARVRPDRGRAPFVVEGDEYDAVYWHKEPKFLDYIDVGENDVAIVTSIEHDHIDIYPDPESYDRAFERFRAAIPEKGLLVCDASEERVREMAIKQGKSRVAYYALQGDDTGDVSASWLGAPAPIDEKGVQPFDLYAGGVYAGRFAIGNPGAHNVRNAVGAIAACTEGFGVTIVQARTALASFAGVKRRQDLLGEPNGVRVYDDFAHHPTAVDETLRALRAKHRDGNLWAVFEPRSATACRNLHQDAYATAFSAANYVIFAPLGRANLAPEERLDVDRLTAAIGPHAEAATSIDAILDRIARDAKPGDTVALLSNGAFGGLHARLLQALASRS
jgi:UDP-N-acetylmuramate: L-alanyl-gamma-D-glutamyl-meso-diaminopimelate ligase